jgi:hypothetical protein
MKYQISDIIKILPKEAQTEHIDQVIMILLDFLVYMKPGDSLSIPGDVQFEKIDDTVIMLPQFFLPKQWSNREFQDVVKLLQEHKLLKSR